MNKKVLTLCAGVLLVSGSAVFTMNALNVGNDGIQSTYVAKATTETNTIAGYELSTDEVDNPAIWSLVKTTGGYYLSPATGYFLASDGSIKSIETSEPELVTLVGAKKDNPYAIAFVKNVAWDDLEGSPILYLWKGGSQVTKVSAQTGLVLATSKTAANFVTDQNQGATNENTKIAYFDTESKDVKVSAWSGEDSKNEQSIWHFTGEVLSAKYQNPDNGNQNEAWLIYSEANGFQLSWAATDDNKAHFVYEDGTLKLKTLSQGQIKNVPVYLTESGFSLEADSEDAPNAPAVFFKATLKDGKIDANTTIAEVSSEDETEGYFVIGQGTMVEMADVEYVANKIEDAAENAPGIEYGHIDGIQFQEDGTLRILHDVVTANVPVYIYYKNGDKTVYLTVDGWKDDVKAGTVWILDGGKLVTLDGKHSIAEVTYIKDKGVSNLPEGADNAVIELAQVSLPAQEIENGCDIPLLNDVVEDYVILAGRGDDGKPVYINLDNNGDLDAGDDWSTADLWKVTETEELGDGRRAYIFKNREGDKQLEINGYTRFMAYEYNGGIQLLGVDLRTGRIENPVIINGSGTSAAITTGAGPAAIIGFYQSKLEQYNAHWLLHRYGSSFKLNVVDKYKNIADKTIWGNEFADADLVPVVVDTNGELHEVVSENDTYGSAQQFLLKKKGTNLYIVLNVSDDWSNAVESFIQGGYMFETLSKANVEEVLRTGSVNGKNYYPYFQINYLEGKTKAGSVINGDAVQDNTPAHCVEVGYWNGSEYVFPYDLANLETTDTKGHLDVFVSVVENCGHDDARMPQISFYTDNENIVRGEDSENNPLLYKYVNISFKSGANMQFQNEENSWVNLNGKVLGINKEGFAAPTEPEYFLADKAEGMWYVTMTGAEGLKATDDAVDLSSIDSRKFTFTNREDPTVTLEVKVMHALGNDVYAVEYDLEDWQEEEFAQYAWYDRPFGFYTAKDNQRNQVMRDTLVIKAADIDKTIAKGAAGLHDMDSYANWTKEDLQDKTFQLSIDASAQLYVTENEGKDSHFLGLSSEEADVTNWRLVPFTAARVHDTDAVRYLTAGTDSVYVMAHPQYYSNGKFYAYNDTTAIITYALQNIQNNEWLTYDPSQSQTIESMICDPNSKNYTTANLDEAYRFVLKEKAEGAQKIESGAYSIIGVTPWGLNDDKYVKLQEKEYPEQTIYDEVETGREITGTAYYGLNLDKKLYGATSYQRKGAIEVEYAYLQPTSNDIFTIATTASQEYVKATPRDTVRIYGAEENDFLLFEKGQFLNLGNANGIAPAMVLDSAYVERPGNNRYQYLLVVNPHYTEPVYDQLHGGDYHLVTPEKMEGRFLVNMIDSAVAEARNHNNPYINDIEADQKKLKLGFEWGYRTQDTLFLTDGQGGPVLEKIYLGTPDFNKAKFAFKYVNEAASDEFKIQTAWYDYDSAVKAGSDNKDAWTWNNEGFLESVNGVIVVTNGYTHGEEFLMAQEDSDPTANESINANGAVSVVATDGAVVIKGAEGKNVVIATILGKVVANETINSDNETIAVPAGIAVVSVDGESFKVVVK